jgi:hypothetical protein
MCCYAALLLPLSINYIYTATSANTRATAATHYTQALQESDQEQLCDEDLLPEDSTDVSKAARHQLNGGAMDVDGEEPQLHSLDNDAAVDDELDELDLDSTAVAAAVWDGTGTFKMQTADLQVYSITFYYYVFAFSYSSCSVGHAAGVTGSSMTCLSLCNSAAR